MLERPVGSGGPYVDGIKKGRGLSPRGGAYCALGGGIGKQARGGGLKNEAEGSEHLGMGGGCREGVGDVRARLKGAQKSKLDKILGYPVLTILQNTAAVATSTWDSATVLSQAGALSPCSWETLAAPPLSPTPLEVASFYAFGGCISGYRSDGHHRDKN